MLFAIVIIPAIVTLLWLLSIRPYCRRHGKGFTPGANIPATFWVDWQEAGEISKAKDDRPMILICRLVLWLHIAGLGFVAFAIFGS